MTSHTQNTWHKNGSTQAFLGATFKPGQSSCVPSHSCSVWACCGARTYRTTRFGKPPECPTGTPPQYSHLDSISFGLLGGGSAAAGGGSCGGGGGGGGVCVWGGGDGEVAGLLFLLLSLPILMPKQTCSALKQPEPYKPNTQWSKHTMIQTHNDPNTQWSKHTMIQTHTDPNTMIQTHNDPNTHWSKHTLIQTHNDPNSTQEVKRNATLRWQYKIHKCARSG